MSWPATRDQRSDRTDAFATASTGADGSYVTSFIVLDAGPDGRLTDRENLPVIALNSTGSVMAAAPFTFDPSSEP